MRSHDETEGHLSEVIMAETAEKEKFTLVLFSGDLDKALAAFILATTAASMGMEVTMFFTFWGLNIIKKNEGSPKSKGWMRKMLNLINRGGSRRLKLSKFNMLGMGTSMMKKLMKESNMPSIDEFITMAQEMGIKMVPCSTSCGILGVPDEAFRGGVMSQAGAAFFLGQARESKVTLFI
jgi:peroxiredoxin family protein